MKRGGAQVQHVIQQPMVDCLNKLFHGDSEQSLAHTVEQLCHQASFSYFLVTYPLQLSIPDTGVQHPRFYIHTNGLRVYALQRLYFNSFRFPDRENSLLYFVVPDRCNSVW